MTRSSLSAPRSSPKPAAAHIAKSRQVNGWLSVGFGVALGWLCTPESMPSICLLYGFGVALGGFPAFKAEVVRPPPARDNELQFRQLRRHKHYQLCGFDARTTY